MLVKQNPARASTVVVVTSFGNVAKGWGWMGLRFTNVGKPFCRATTLPMLAKLSTISGGPLLSRCLSTARAWRRPAGRARQLCASYLAGLGFSLLPGNNREFPGRRPAVIPLLVADNCRVLCPVVTQNDTFGHITGHLGGIRRCIHVRPGVDGGGGGRISGGALFPRCITTARPRRRSPGRARQLCASYLAAGLGFSLFPGNNREFPGRRPAVIPLLAADNCG